MSKLQSGDDKGDPQRQSNCGQVAACLATLHAWVSRVADWVKPWKEVFGALTLVGALVGGGAVLRPNPQVDPELTNSQAPKPALGDANGPLQCVDARSISEAYALIGDGKFDEKEANFSKSLSSRKICGRGWAAVWEQSITTLEADYVILRDASRRNRKMQVRITSPTTGFRDGSGVWVTDAAFGVLPKSEVLIATNANIQPRETAPKPAPTAQKKPGDEKGETKDADGSDREIRINLGIFELVVPTGAPTHNSDPSTR